jgi:hypothetical protein
LYACKQATPEEYNAKAADPELLYNCSKHLTDVIIHDIFKPPVASRIYGYTYLATYEAMRPGFPAYQPLGGKLNGYTDAPAPEAGKEYCFSLAGIKAFTVAARNFTFSADMWDGFEKDLFKKYKDMGIPDDVYERSIAYGDQVAQHVIAYSAKDNYKQIRGFRHTITRDPGTWVPTPPAYADACEPKWNTIRTFTLDSINQFPCPKPAKYDLAKTSPFWKLTDEVYTIGKNLTQEQKDIAYFWDDNAFVTNITGHVMFASKKMTPPGHWMAIITTVSRQKQRSMIQAAEAYSLSSFAIFDAFIACWDEKYKHVRIRPETVINTNLDPEWRPFLETPAFPEYVSGHSAISAAAGQILTNLIGDNVAYTDSTEYEFGHGVRKFASFKQAYQEASISRVYGGIHFRDGVEEGTYQGEKVGQWVLQKLGVKKEPVIASGAR